MMILMKLATLQFSWTLTYIVTIVKQWRDYRGVSRQSHCHKPIVPDTDIQTSNAFVMLMLIMMKKLLKCSMMHFDVECTCRRFFKMLMWFCFCLWCSSVFVVVVITVIDYVVPGKLKDVEIAEFVFFYITLLQNQFMDCSLHFWRLVRFKIIREYFVKFTPVFGQVLFVFFLMFFIKKNTFELDTSKNIAQFRKKDVVVT